MSDGPVKYELLTDTEFYGCAVVSIPFITVVYYRCMRMARFIVRSQWNSVGLNSRVLLNHVTGRRQRAIGKEGSIECRFSGGNVVTVTSICFPESKTVESQMEQHLRRHKGRQHVHSAIQRARWSHPEKCCRQRGLFILEHFRTHSKYHSHSLSLLFNYLEQQHGFMTLA